jgi:DNA excision repair protein ERCC-2
MTETPPETPESTTTKPSKRSGRPVTLSVRDFALPAPRRGSVEAHSGLAFRQEQGVEIHAEIQATRTNDVPGYRAEVPTVLMVTAGPYQFRVTGRIDGVYPAGTESPNVLLEEIKTAFDVDALRDKLAADPFHPYVLQLRTYGYSHFKKHGTEPELRLLLVSARSRVEIQMPVALGLEEYEAWLARRSVELEAEEKLRRRVAKRRKKTGARLAFPFAAPRPGQEELIKDLETQLAAKAHVLVQAPTGLGKTVGILFPTLSHALARSSPVVYVTPKNSQHRVAEDAVARLQEAGAEITSLTVTARRRACLMPEPVCDPEHCPFAKDHYTKVAAAELVPKVAKRRRTTLGDLRRLGQKHEVCPYELAQEAASLVDVVIGDYNYVIDSQSLVTRIGAQLRAPEAAPNLVIDEAHNFFPRACDNLSATLSARDLAGRRELVAQLPAPFAQHASSLIDAMAGLVRDSAPADWSLDLGRGRGGAGRGYGDTVVASPDVEGAHRLGERVQAFLAAYLASSAEIRDGDPALRLAFDWQAFGEALDKVGEAGDRYVALYDRGRGDEQLRVICCDASEHLQEQLELFSRVVGFSATLKPFDYYAKLSGFDMARFAAVERLSPFPREHRKVLVIPQVSTKLKDRSREARRIADAIARVVAVRPGNYAAFFPSYQFLSEVATHLTPSAGGFVVRRQTPGMSAADIDECLAALAAAEAPNLVLAVQGGALAEGIDYRGDLLIGALIVGPGLPSADGVRETLRAYYEKHYGQGDDYAYTYPAMAKVVQAAGRVIRSESDRGLIVLLDRRFLEPRFASLMPKDWYDESVQELVSTKILADVREFWERSE